ncbi:MAG: cyclic 2,3-diphosphoglycerate synthase [Gaiellaceae bacterium]|nr:cyclic 2,3-diphosphoglycerate synthase [Gaiellaceae bacterium]
MAGARRVVALVDGEHYPPVVAAAISSTGGVVAALLLGGSEKLRGAPSAAGYGVARLDVAHGDAPAALARLLTEVDPDLVVDLSDEPVVTQRSRLRLAAVALHAGVAYRAGGLLLEPERRAPYALPSIAVAGTGKRVGKTAVAGQLARVARGRVAPGEVVIVAMGRGGPAAPELVEPGAVDVPALLGRSRAGQHAASDFLEDALLAGVTAIGCRRCGAGLAGDVVHSTVAEGAVLAAARAPALTIFEGSGACLPPVAARRTLLVTSSVADPEEVLGYLGPYRLLRADAVLVVGDRRNDALEAGIRELRPGVPVVPCSLVPQPSEPIAGRRVAVFTTARPETHAGLREALTQRHGAQVVLVSGALADRPALRAAITLADADVFLTELKAAAVDVVAEAAAERGAALVFLGNQPVAHDGSAAVDEVLEHLVDGAIETIP